MIIIIIIIKCKHIKFLLYSSESQSEKIDWDIDINAIDNKYTISVRAYHNFIKKLSFTVRHALLCNFYFIQFEQKQIDLLLYFLYSFFFQDKKFFSVRNCDFCGRKFFFNVFTCSCQTCDFTLCQRCAKDINECSATDDRLVCNLNKHSSMESSQSSVLSKQKHIYVNNDNKYELVLLLPDIYFFFKV